MRVSSLSSYLLFTSVILLNANPASAVDVSLLVGMNRASSNLGVSNPDNNLGYGIEFAESPMRTRSGFELGAYYMKRKGSVLSSSAIAFDQTVIQVAVPYRFWLGPVLSVAAGPYISYSLEQGTLDRRLDYGILAGGRVGLPINKSWTRILIGIRYLYGLKTTFIGRVSEIQGWVGIRMGL